MATKKKVAKKVVKKVAKKTAKTVAKMTIASNMGQAVPDILLPSTGGQNVNLKEFKGKKVVLFFYPKDMTPGCTIEGHEFTKLKNKFADCNAVVMGVSRDTVESHEKFKEKECYTIDLLSDTDEKLCNAFGVIKDKNMYGKMVRGIERSTFVINESGHIEHEWRGVKAEGHAGEVLNYLTQKVPGTF